MRIWDCDCWSVAPLLIWAGAHLQLTLSQKSAILCRRASQVCLDQVGRSFILFYFQAVISEQVDLTRPVFFSFDAFFFYSSYLKQNSTFLQTRPWANVFALTFIPAVLNSAFQTTALVFTLLMCVPVLAASLILN